MNKKFRDLIKLICSENNISFHVLSLGFLLVLEKNGVIKTISGYKFDNNSHSLGKVFDDKFATYELLKYFDIPVCEHSIFYCRDNCNTFVDGYNTLEYLQDKFNEYDRNVVVKKNAGSCGHEVYHFNNFIDLEDFYNNTISNMASFSICPFYNIENEYRVIVLNNKVKLIYKKVLPRVYGDGHSTIRELLMKFNPSYFKSVNDVSLDCVLKDKEEFSYDWKFNLSAGSLPSFDINEIDRLAIEKIISKITDNISIGFCSIDIIKTTELQYLVMEINSGVMMNHLITEVNAGYDLAKEIYTEAVLSMFDVNN